MNVPPAEKNTRRLTDLVERKDRRFRTAQTIFMVLLSFAIILLLTISLKTLQAVQEQLRAQEALTREIQRTSDAQDKLREQQLNRVNRHLDCIVLFFQQPNRASIKIEDINSCTLDNSSDELPSFTLPRNDGAMDQKQPAATADQPAASAPSTAPQSPDPEPNQPGPPSTPPGKVLDICVRVIRLCTGL